MEHPGQAWVVAEQRELVLPLAVSADVRTWCLQMPLNANRQTMLLVEVVLDCDETIGTAVEHGYRTDFVVEWEGWNTLHFPAGALEPIGTPRGLSTVKRLRLRAGSATFAGTVLTVGRITWPEVAPLIPVTPGEVMVVNFMGERFWNRADWSRTGDTELPAGEEGFDPAWMYVNLRYRQKPGRYHRTAYRRRMNVDLTPYQAVSLFTATDVRAAFSLVLEIDGQAVRAIDRRRGLGGGDEMRATLTGRRLTALTVELEQAEPEVSEAIEVEVASSIRWVLLERKGADPAQAGEAEGIPPVAPPPVPDPGAEILPVGLLVGRKEFAQLRKAASAPGWLHKMATEMVAQAAALAEYQPEAYAGRYLPVDLGNQGCERKVSPWDQMKTVNAAMVYGAVAYALTGEVRHAQTARRALFTVVRCTAWQGGFPSRIPCGLPGYRAPFIEAHTAENVAVCYDFIFPLLTAAERREVEDALYAKALPWIDMYLRLKGEGYLLRSNQGAVFSAGLFFAALVARRSHPDVDPILERGIHWFGRMMNLYYREDGSTTEGPGYWEYTTKSASAALMAISRHLGRPVRDCGPAQLGRTMDYLMHMRSLARSQLSFIPLGDNIESVGYPCLGSSLLFFAKYYGKRNALWLWHRFFADRVNPPGSVHFGKPSAGTYATAALMDFLLFVADEPVPPQLPPAERFAVCDRVLWRTGSEDGDMLVLFDGGAQTFEHTHFDKGQFVFEAMGERFAADPGVVRYQDPASLNYKGTPYHNLVTWRGHNQDYRDPLRAVEITRLESGGSWDYLEADLRNSYRILRRYVRRLLFVRPHYLLVCDEVESTEPGLEWNYHSGAPITGVDLTTGLIQVAGERATMMLAIAADQPLMARRSVYASEGTVLTHNLVLDPPAGTTQLKLAAVLLPSPASAPDSARPTVRVENRADGPCFAVSGSWGVDQVHCEWGGGAGVTIRWTGAKGEETAWAAMG